MTHNSVSNTLTEDLVISILAVYRFSLEKVFAIKDQLKANHIFDSNFVRVSKVAVIAKALEDSGYNRNSSYLYEVFAERVIVIHDFISSDRMMEFQQVLDNKDYSGINCFLRPLRGVGTATVKNFCILRGIE